MLLSDDLKTKLDHYRINPSEFSRMKDLLGREPQGVEWAIFSALWSEHCSYKSSKIHLKKFYSSNERVLQAFGENAGVIDLGEGERVAFKMESHNHPSFIEPYEGAATGVGGILRDIFTMGARPIALANYLCFGQASAARMPILVDGVVRGIGGYGNCVGVPTITGQTEFHESYDNNILVNALAVGLFRPGEKVFTSQAHGVGNYVVYVGAKTGRDGIHGASMASESFDKESESLKPTIQKGDPFLEKLLIESCIEVMKRDLVVAIQDMGAAGLTSSAFEMSEKGGVGFKLDLDKVPLRDSSITPEEILLSESQERMLLICEPQRFEELQKVFALWSLDAEKIGVVTEDKDIELCWHNETLTKIDPSLVVDQAPLYEREHSSWSPLARSTDADLLSISTKSPEKLLLSALADLRGNQRKWIYEQYDQRVGAQTICDASEPVGAVRLPDSGRALGLVLGCRPSMMRFDALEGGKDSVCYPALELASKGFRPLALTDCLNFGNPERPALMTEFVAALKGMNEACKSFDTPVISGNVSLYNETNEKNVTSTPSTGLVGLRKSLANIPGSSFRENGEEVFLVQCLSLASTGLWAELNDQKIVGQGEIDIDKTMAFARAIEALSLQPAVRATRVVGKFGLPYTLARMCITNNLGVQVEDGPWLDKAFQERCYEVLFVTDSAQRSAFIEKAKELLGNERLGNERLGNERSGNEHTGGKPIGGVFEFSSLGQVKSDELQWGKAWSVKVADLKKAYTRPWEEQLEGLA